ncbi:MAG: NAD(P)-dependent oxidoreductase [Pseudomonadota bacterium]
MSTPKIIVYGGNGFVGCKVAEGLASAGAKVICVSRTGSKPAHLAKESWADNIEWVQGDASKPDLGLLKDCHAVVCLVGSPPVPTVGKEAYEQQVFNNGETNRAAIAAAGETGVKRVVLLGAKIPGFLSGDWLGYAKGKRMSLEAAKEFAQLSDDHRAVVIQPGGIFGKRHTAGGAEIPIDIVMRPMSMLLPSQLISVDRVAERIVNEALNKTQNPQNLTIISHSEI